MRAKPPSPPRTPPRKKDGSPLALNPAAELNPEVGSSPRTLELARDQSLAARNLIYHPNQQCLEVVQHCAAGMSAIAARLAPTPTDTPEIRLEKDEVLISMSARLMNGDPTGKGGTAGIANFRRDIENVARLAAVAPYPTAEYTAAAHALAERCRAKFAQLSRDAVLDGPGGALARQGLLAFMGDLGGLEPKETGYGGAYLPPLTGAATAAARESALGINNPTTAKAMQEAREKARRDGTNEDEAANKAEQSAVKKAIEEAGAKRVYDYAVAGTCDAQRALRGQGVASAPEVAIFKTELEAARRATSLKGGALSAPEHTSGKKEERVMAGFAVRERAGLLGTGDEAERMLSLVDGHEPTLVNASWPEFVVSRELVQDVVEPVTGHVSGTFGEMAISMDLFCGTPPKYLSRSRDVGEPIHPEEGGQAPAIGALAAAGLITAGFHTAVEIYQPLCTFTTKETIGGLGPAAEAATMARATALEFRRDHPADPDAGRIYRWQYPKGTLPFHTDELSATELRIPRGELDIVISHVKYHASKQHDFIATLQGGGTQATQDLCLAMDAQSANPGLTQGLYSMQTRLEMLSQRGQTVEYEKAKALAELPVSEEQQRQLKSAITAAERAADHYDLLRVTVDEIEEIAAEAEVRATKAEGIVLAKKQALEIATKEANETASIGWKIGGDPKAAVEARKKLSSVEEVRKQAFREERAARLEATALRAEATAIRLEATAAKVELANLRKEVSIAAKAELNAARAEASAARTDTTASKAEARAVETEATAKEKSSALAKVTKELDELLKVGWGERVDPNVARDARGKAESLEEVRKQAFRANKAAQAEATTARKEAIAARKEAIAARKKAGTARKEAIAATASKQEVSVMVDKFVGMKDKMQGMKREEGPDESQPSSSP